jgi:SHS2 domain-containing protein
VTEWPILTEGFEHTALGSDLVEVKGRGASIPAAFAQAALGVLDLVAGRPLPGGRERREVRAHGPSLDELLAVWIGECLYVHEIEGWAADRIEFSAFTAAATAGGEPLRLHAFVHGGEVPPGRPTAKTAMVRRASLEQDPSGFVAVVLLEADHQSQYSS